MILWRENKAANLSLDMIGQFWTISCDYVSTWGWCPAQAVTRTNVRGINAQTGKCLHQQKPKAFLDLFRCFYKSCPSLPLMRKCCEVKCIALKLSRISYLLFCCSLMVCIAAPQIEIWVWPFLPHHMVMTWKSGLRPGLSVSRLRWCPRLELRT